MLKKEAKFIQITQYTAKFGPYKLWIENFPYSAFTVTNEDDNREANGRPSRKTIYLLSKKLAEDSQDC